MINWYREKRDFHHKQWEKAQNENKPIAAKQHMNEYINYDELVKQQGSANPDTQ